MAARPATLHAVKVPVKPDTKAKPMPINALVIGVRVTL